jgi:hypothetical protein
VSVPVSVSGVQELVQELQELQKESPKPPLHAKGRHTNGTVSLLAVTLALVPPFSTS